MQHLQSPSSAGIAGAEQPTSAGKRKRRVEIETELLERGYDEFECALCMLVLDDPTSGCPEGHTFCRSCYSAALAKSNECPSCRTAMEEGRLTRNLPLETLISQQRLRCRHAAACSAQPAASSAKKKAKKNRSAAGDAHGCAWRGTVEEYASHLEACPLEPVTCPTAGCRATMPRRDIDQHTKDECLFRAVPCRHCKTKFPFHALARHETVQCLEAPAGCPNAGCDAVVTRATLHEHRAECAQEMVTCPHEGCGVELPRGEMVAHASRTTPAHLRSSLVSVALRGINYARDWWGQP